jgi:hypothetical protein
MDAGRAATRVYHVTTSGEQITAIELIADPARLDLVAPLDQPVRGRPR